jgi:hypothetical protein
MQLAEVGERLQILYFLDKIIAEVEAAQLIVLFEGRDSRDAPIG